MSRRSPSTSFPFVRFPCGDMRHPSAISYKSYLLSCPTHCHLCPLIYSIKSVTCVFFFPVCLFLSHTSRFFLSVFVRLLLPDWWVSMFMRCVLLMEVRMSCRLVSSSRFQSYPWIRRGAWGLLSIRPWFFFESPSVRFCLWCVSQSQVDRGLKGEWSGWTTTAQT